MLPPGCAMLATKPCSTGSLTITKIVGMECVAFFIAAMTGVPISDDEVGCERHQFRRAIAYPLDAACGPAPFDLQVTPFGPAQIQQRLPERGDALLSQRIVLS